MKTVIVSVLLSVTIVILLFSIGILDIKVRTVTFDGELTIKTNGGSIYTDARDIVMTAYNSNGDLKEQNHE